jgi:hypothetical protein
MPGLRLASTYNVWMGLTRSDRTQRKLLQGVAESVPGWRQLAARLDLCLCLEDDRLSRELLRLPVNCLHVAVGCMRTAGEKAAVEARAARCMADAPQRGTGVLLPKLLLVAAWVGASVPAVVERLMTRKVGYEELKALGACVEQGASGPMMDLLQVGGGHQFDHQLHHDCFLYARLRC